MFYFILVILVLILNLFYMLDISIIYILLFFSLKWSSNGANKASSDLSARLRRLQQTVCMNALHACLHELSRQNMSLLTFLWWIDMILLSPVVIYDHSVINLFFMWQSVKTCSNDTLSKFSMLVGDTVEHKHTLFEFFFVCFRSP